MLHERVPHASAVLAMIRDTRFTPFAAHHFRGGARMSSKCRQYSLSDPLRLRCYDD